MIHLLLLELFREDEGEVSVCKNRNTLHHKNRHLFPAVISNRLWTPQFLVAGGK